MRFETLIPLAPHQTPFNLGAAMESLQQQVADVREQAAEAIDFILADLRQKWKELSGGPSVTEGVRQFIAAVDWNVSDRLLAERAARLPNST